MMRYFIDLSYNGTHYRGWQIQKNAPSVQAKLNECISIILRQEIETTGSGRTDAGVHARQQYAHFDYDKPINVDQVKYKLNRFLPPDISIHRIIPVMDRAHARFDAVKRSYEYIISRVKDPFRQNLAYYFNISLDISLMNEAALMLSNWDDYQSFSKVKTDVNHFHCKIFQAGWEEVENRLIFHITADRFLRGMVRSLVGTMLEIGQHRIDLLDLEHIIESRDREKAGRAVPTHGLFLTKVEYPQKIFIK